MGLFSYTCTKCGPKDVFDFMEECVVKVDSTHVKGTYDGRGRVHVQIQGRNDPVRVIPDQNLWQTKNDHGLVASDIYCNGESQPTSPRGICEQLLKKIAKQQSKELNVLVGGGLGLGDGYESDDDKPRFCVPPKIQVLDKLPQEFLTKLPAETKTEGPSFSTIKDVDSSNKKKRKVGAGGLEGAVTGAAAKKVAVIEREPGEIY